MERKDKNGPIVTKDRVAQLARDPSWLIELGLQPGFAALANEQFNRALRSKPSIRNTVLRRQSRRIAMALLAKAAS